MRKRFDAAYAAPTKNGRLSDNFRMWVGVDLDPRGIARSVGSGIAKTVEPVVYPIAELVGEAKGASPEDALAGVAEDGRRTLPNRERLPQ